MSLSLYVPDLLEYCHMKIPRGIQQPGMHQNIAFLFERIVTFHLSISSFFEF